MNGPGSGQATGHTPFIAGELDQRGAPLLNVFGGKLTTYRKLAEQAMAQLMPLLPPMLRAWTAKGHPLPAVSAPTLKPCSANCSQRARSCPCMA
ncbi:MAG: hypothetical protein EPN69_11350 [Rhodanobacter sp.]|nr:MAG: hypothetical protein EPN69_11350 [Rhodanobacter sp.]TAM02438.1 MAG: hypothetical protein EPN71_04710 [Rhodanobacter sp.]TAM41737.1 MAG: hypothetical protein EPN58_05595 [Rhodanobacter sp.]TAN23334.1 MAG: hypothetical protein EPN32_11665 [Rhodanobacter sp.]